ncbi:thermonuclease family protein [Neobacillus pocheonensis]|uniref:thermonuclease family protein n=1 Tax=Neobacillus pocheonensis TaxID=363869 RepID=UPI003D2ADBE1
MKGKYLQLILLLFISAFTILSGCTSGNVTEKSQPKKTIPAVQDEQKKENETETIKEPISSIESDNKKLLPATIVKNIDGDTVEIGLNGKVEKIRMLCVDTPETHHPRLGVQPFGPEASNYTKKILSVGTKVEIEPGIGGGRDKYGRLLAYIYINGKMFNEMLLEQGLARVAYIYAPNTKYVDEFYTIQKEAQKKGIGIWSIENYAQEDGYHSTTAQGGREKISSSPSGSTPENNFQNNPNDDQEANLDCKGKIKGNANSHIYHVPGGSYYSSTVDNIVWFCTEKEAQDAGYRKSKR